MGSNNLNKIMKDYESRCVMEEERVWGGETGSNQEQNTASGVSTNNTGSICISAPTGSDHELSQETVMSCLSEINKAVSLLDVQTRKDHFGEKDSIFKASNTQPSFGKLKNMSSSFNKTVGTGIPKWRFESEEKTLKPNEDVQLLKSLPDIAQQEILRLYSSRWTTVPLKIFVKKSPDFDSAFELTFRLDMPRFYWVPDLRLGITKEYPGECPVIFGLGIGNADDDIQYPVRHAAVMSAFRGVVRDLPWRFLIQDIVQGWVNTVICIHRKLTVSKINM